MLRSNAFSCLRAAAVVLALLTVWSWNPTGGARAASVVELIGGKGEWSLSRDGKPFFINGAGGSEHLKELREAGGNCIRTWGVDDNTGKLLDEAQRHGLGVCLGIWLGHERHGFKYSDEPMVKEQLVKAREAVARFKDHPALVCWGLGNEMEGFGAGDEVAIWRAVNDVAAAAKQLDPNHPTMTVVAEIGGKRVESIHRLCPQIDIVGLNSYGGAATIAKRYRKAGGTKPFLLTEFGPPGHWEVGKTAWGAAIEPTSTAKAESYRRVWAGSVAGERGKLCLGGFAFLWGHKQEVTPTWFSMFLPDGAKVASVDAMTEQWTGKPPRNRCPQIAALRLEGMPKVKPGTAVTAKLEASDPEGDELKVRWELLAEPAGSVVGGDAQATPPSFEDAIVKASRTEASVKMPESGGGYRLFVYVYDGKGGAATANAPLLCDGPAKPMRGGKAKLPLVIYGDKMERTVYVPSGWMGSTEAIALDPKCAENPRVGATCLKASYAKPDGWGGVVWQHPENDWGEKPGGLDLTGAKRLVFWARGERGGERVKFGFGLLGPEKRFSDTDKSEKEVRLSKEWKELSIDLSGLDLSRIKTGFMWTAAGQGQPITFYLDEVRYE